MNKKFRFVLLMLLGLAFNSVYADNERVVLYEHSFADGSDSWSTNNYAWLLETSQGWVKGNPCDANTYWGTLSKTIQFGGKFYKDIQIEVKTPDDLTSEEIRLSIYIENNHKEIEAQASNYSYNATTQTGTLSLNYPQNKVVIRIKLKQENTDNRYYIKSVKVTGVFCYDYNSPANYNTLQSFSELYTQPAGSIVKVDFNDATMLKCDDMLWIIRDNSGCVFIQTDDMIKNNTFYPNNENIVSGTLYGVVNKDFECAQLVGATIKNGSFLSKQGNTAPKCILEENYLDNIGEYVTMPFTSDVIMWDITGNNPTYKNPQVVSPESMTNYCISGYVFPTANNETRFLYSNLSSACGIVFSEVFNNDINAGKTGQGCTIARRMEEGKWYSLILPFDFTNDRGPIAEFVSAENGTLTFQTVNSVEAGHPFLFKPSYNINSLWGTIALNSSNPQRIYGTDYNFVGVFNDSQPIDGCYYLAAGATIKPLSSGGTIKGLRAYFEPNIPATARTRSITLDIDGQTTAISDVVWGEEEDNAEAIYDLKGQYVGNNKDALRKGVYIINGKKFMK